jgi:phage shock protein PspC (stress-responsive transcriptional regulator)
MWLMDRLYRSVDDRVLAGVAGGMAELWDIDPSLVRIMWVVLTPFTAGFTILLYLVMAIVVPEEPIGGEADLGGSPGMGASQPGGPSPEGGYQPAGGSSPAGDSASTSSGWVPGAAAWREQRRAEKARRQVERAQWRAERRANRAGGPDTGAIVGGIVLVLIGAAALAGQIVPGFDWGRAWPIVLILIGGLLIARSAWPGNPRS